MDVTTIPYLTTVSTDGTSDREGLGQKPSRSGVPFRSKRLERPQH